MTPNALFLVCSVPGILDYKLHVRTDSDFYKRITQVSDLYFLQLFTEKIQGSTSLMIAVSEFGFLKLVIFATVSGQCSQKSVIIQNFLNKKIKL